MPYLNCFEIRGRLGVSRQKNDRNGSAVNLLHENRHSAGDTDPV